MSARTCAWLLPLVLGQACAPAIEDGALDTGRADRATADAGGADRAQPSDDGGAPRDGAGPVDAGGAEQPTADVLLDAPTTGDAGQGDAGQGDAIGPYGQAGPLAVRHESLEVDTGERRFTAEVYLPAGSGAHPVLSLSPGVQQGAGGYLSYAARLASHGIIVLLRDDPGVLVNTAQVADDLGYLMTTWLTAQNADASSPLYGRVDTTALGLAGHSRGGKASLIAAELALHGKVRAWFGIDPVDSAVVSGDIQARDALPQLGIPTAFLGATVSSTCSPAPDNYEVLFPLAPSPSVLVEAIGAGHVQFQDPEGCSLCGLCTPAGTADAAVVLDYSVRYLTAFFARELLGDASVGAAFEGAGAAADIAAGRVSITAK